MIDNKLEDIMNTYNVFTVNLDTLLQNYLPNFLNEFTYL
jgi:hypothetical protein